MKIFAAFAISSASAITCYTGFGTSIAEFEANAVVTTCYANEETCQLTVRQRGGVIESVIGSCKAQDACIVNRSYNFEMATQCRPEETKDANGVDITSVCRSCTLIDTDQLLTTKFKTVAQWKDDLLQPIRRK